MPLLETDYCVEQINVPPKLPMILKQFCKSAIRTQPYDLLKWSTAYFRALAEGEEPPTKLRLEFPPACSPFGLTIGYLKVLLRQLGGDCNKVLPLEKILERWDQLCLDRRDSDLIILIGGFRNKCQVKKFLSIAVGLLTRNLTETMSLVCDLFTYHPDGCSAMIPLGLFMEIYGYLASLKCDGSMKASCLCSESERDSEKEVVSVASQDTEVDIDLDLESLTKDDVQSVMTLQSFGEETEESFRHEGEASYRSFDGTVSSRSSKSIEKVEIKKESETMKEVQQVESDVSKKYVSRRSSTESESIQYYPNVPGIGCRLSAKEVAAVAIWMSECARRQDGMVGARNIRHINCPPLEGWEARTRTQKGLLKDF
ncbi:ropporin-1-like protein isoform X1 [Phymastichus coffea]|uniref:ropporin-1-like protein isoform X1 n=1 Tax=Phymastichus coffea TaxID=108790 RepID=UPI00273CD945|nr:ropporin-1-like protein isoform X1 [Phymastichus coffea]